MPADLTYDISELDALASRLTRLGDQMSSDGRLGDVGADEVNSSEVSDALDDFADNWDDKRTEVAQSLAALSEMVAQAVEAFDGADRELAAKAREIIEQQEQEQADAEQEQAEQRESVTDPGGAAR